MKNILYSLVVLVFCTATAFGQFDAKKSSKSAQKALSTYQKDEINNIGNLMEAKSLVDEAVIDEIGSADADIWLVHARVYDAITKHQVNGQAQAELLGQSFEIFDETSGVNVFSSVSKVMELASKKNHSNDALNITGQSFGNLNSFAYSLFAAKKYDAAMNTFATMTKMLTLLEHNEKKLPLETEKDIDNLNYMAGLSALQSNNAEMVNQFFEPLVVKQYDDGVIYEGLYKVNQETDKEKALEYLNKGRELYPDNTGLLFAEINHYLALGKTDILVEKLQIAKEKEPGNTSIYLTLGQVYEGIYTTTLEAEGHEAAQPYFDKAFAEYESAGIKDSTFADAFYSQGAMYYNKAVLVNTALNDLPLSAQDEYTRMEKEVKGLFDTALPYFTKAEIIDPNNQNTLIALKEIHAIKGNFDMSNELKIRLDKVLAGEKNETSLFAE